jgi:hypothetical protein
MYNLPFFHSTIRLIEDIKAYNKLGGLKVELQRLSLQKSLLEQGCSLLTEQSKNIASLLDQQKASSQYPEVPRNLINHLGN